MTPPGGRIARFVATARALLALQVLAALLAVAIAAWAFVEVRGMAVERDRLKARVAELEARQGNALQTGPAVPLGPDPLPDQIAPLDLPPPPLLVPPAPADTNVILPAPPPAAAPPPVTDAEEPAAAEPEPAAPVRRWDCSGANAQNPRCRPLMERPNPPLNSLEPRGPALGPAPRAGGNQQGPG